MSEPQPAIALQLTACMLGQERPEDVPTGELPRSMSLLLDRRLVGTVSPGTRITAIGIYSILSVCTFHADYLSGL